MGTLCRPFTAGTPCLRDRASGIFHLSLRVLVVGDFSVYGAASVSSRNGTERVRSDTMGTSYRLPMAEVVRACVRHRASGMPWFLCLLLLECPLLVLIGVLST